MYKKVDWDTLTKSLETKRPTTCSKRTPDGISRKWIDALFARFARIWPSAWAKIAGKADVEEMAEEWSQGLSGLSGRQIGKGIELCREKCKWPPTIAEFRGMAEAKPDWEIRGPAYRIYDPSRRLPKIPSEENRRIAKREFARMRIGIRRSGIESHGKSENENIEI